MVEYACVHVYVGVRKCVRGLGRVWLGEKNMGY